MCDISYTEANLFDMASVEAGVKVFKKIVGLLRITCRDTMNLD